MAVTVQERPGRYDAGLSGLVFFGISLLAGRVFRFPFDDEIFSLNLLDSTPSGWRLFTDLLHAIDVHPPLSYLAFYPLWRLGVGASGLRIESLLFSTAAVMIAHRIVMRLAPSLEASIADRAIVILLIATTPLLLSQGDAIRWYPLFTLLFMACIHAYLRGDALGDRGSAILSGLLASTNFLGFCVFPLLELDRLMRREWKIDWPGLITRSLLAGLFAVPGIVTLLRGLFDSAQPYVGSQLGRGTVVTWVITGIGFFGGDSLGLVQSLATLPAAVLTVWVLYSGLRDTRSRVVALNVGVLFLLLAVGFGKPRSFVYFALCVSILTAYRWLMESRPRPRFAIALIGLVTPILVIANLQGNDTPYKRNTAVPFEEILRFVHANARAGDAVVVSDPVLNWELKHDGRACVTLYLANTDCDVYRAQRLIVIDGYGIGSTERDEWEARKPKLLAGRTEIVRVFFGTDHEARLKRRLNPGMDDYLLAGRIYGARGD